MKNTRNNQKTSNKCKHVRINIRQSQQDKQIYFKTMEKMTLKKMRKNIKTIKI